MTGSPFMNAASRRSVATLLFSTALALLPGSAMAAGAVFIKGGAMNLEKDEQVFRTNTSGTDNVALDDISRQTLGLGWEIRFRHGWAVGIEYLRYVHRFTSSATPAARGEAVTVAGLVTAKKYFFDNGKFHPYVGGGFGLGGSDANNLDYGGLVDESSSSPILHAVLGMELRVDHLSYMLEVRTLAHESRHLGFEASATGVLLGVGYIW